MAKKPTSTKRPGRRGLNVSLHPLTTEQALRAVLSIKPEDAKRITKKPKRTK